MALLLRVLCLVRNPAELDSVTEIEGQTQCVPSAEALLGFSRAKFPVERELKRA